MLELEKENAEVAEIEASDQDYLNELKASIAEQRYHALVPPPLLFADSSGKY